MAATHKGECFCGAVHVEVSGEPEVMGYCHCQSCRSWSAAQRVKGRERRMKSEKSVEIEDRLLRNVDAGTHGVVLRLGPGHNCELSVPSRTPISCATARINRASLSQS